MKVSLTMLLALLVVVPGRAVGQDHRDSGGEDALSRWHLDASPVASVGHEADGPLYEVRGAAIFERHFVVGERSTGSLRFYWLDGTPRKSIGRLGEGPGEFRSLSWVRRFNDRLYAYDSHLQRLTWYSADGLFLESVQVRPFGRYVSVPVVGVFPDGSILAEGFRAPHLPHRPEMRRDDVALLLFDSNGLFVDSLGAYSGSEYYTEPYGNRGRSISPRVLGKRSQVILTDSTYVVLENDTPRMEVYGPRGRHIGAVGPHELPSPVRVTKGHVDRMRSHVMSIAGPESARRVDELFERAEMPDALPYYGWASWRSRNMMASDRDRLWVLKYGGLFSASPTWTVFDVYDGELGELQAADDVVLLAVRGDLAAVLTTTEYDEEIVQLRKIRR